MSAGAPWSVKGIDPKAREIAKDLARRSGMTLGEWLNQVILEDEAPVEPPPRYPTFGRQAAPAPRSYDTYSRPVEDAFRLNDALDRLSARIEAAEHRAAGAIGGIEQAVSEVMARLGDDERRNSAAAARLDGVVDALRAEQARVAERLGRIEQDVAGDSTGEVLKAVEAALAKVAGQVLDGQARTGESFDGLRQELDGVYERLDGAFTEDAAREMVESVIARLSARLEQAERRTTESLQKLESAFGALDARLKSAETRLDDRSHEQRLDALAEDLGARIGDARAEMALRASANDGRLERMDQALQALDDHVHTAEQRSAGAIEKMGQEVLRLADTMGRNVQEAEARSTAALDAASQRLGGEIAAVSARMGGEIADVGARLGGEIAQVNERLTRGLAESERKSALAIDQVSQQLSSEMASAAERFTRGIEAAERRSAEAIERIGGEVSRAAGAMEQRLAQADTAGAQALERLSGEIARITERLTERIANAERRSAQAIDDVGEQVSRVSERIQERQERASTELSDRIRASEERTAKLLDEARERIDQRLAETQRKLEVAAPAPEPHGFDAYADPAVAPFGADGFATEAADATTVGRALPHGFADDSFVDPTLTVAAEPDHQHVTHGLAEAAAPAARSFADDDFVQDVDFEPFTAEASAAHATERVADDHPDDPFAVGPEAEASPLAHDPFTDDADLIEPAHAEELAADFGSGLFAAASEPHELDADEDWLAPVADRAEDEAAAHQAFAAADEAAHAEGAPSADTLAALASHVEDTGEHADPEADAGFEAADEFVPAEPARPRTTRELVDQARAAARSAAAGQDVKGKAKKGGSLFGGLGRKRSAGGDTMRTALLVSGGTAALGVALVGYVLLASKPGGALPDRVAQSLGSDAPAHPATGEVSNHPLAAIALSPKPIAGQAPVSAPVGSGGAELYNAAVQKIGAGDKAGLGALQKAANLGYPPAQFYLAKLYEDGQAGLPKDMVEARRWTERAAEGGDRKAMHNLALYFFEGAGGPKNLTSSADWFRRAADQGLVDSQYNLARLYEEGLGVPQNPAEAYKWYLIAARSGDGDSRLSALRIKSQLSPEAQSAAQRAADGFQVQTAQAAASPAIAGGPGAGSDVATAQRALSRLGFYQGPADGASSPALKLAIAAYQRGQGLPATGQLDPALSQRLAAVAQP
jgi:localization factor PodJL